MECLPAIDLQEGTSVRLLRGDFDTAHSYGDPVEQAKRYEDAGASILHVVDLDAARTGEPTNIAVIEKIVAAVVIPVEVGGGVRTAERAAQLFGLGTRRVVLGTRAVEQPEFANDLATEHPGRVVLGLDYRREETTSGARRTVAVRGWAEGSEHDLVEFVTTFSAAPFAALEATAIDQDGTLGGPDLDGYRALLGATELPLVASGGVGSLDHLALLSRLEVDGRRLAGAIVGKALVEGMFSIEEAVCACGT